MYADRSSRTQVFRTQVFADEERERRRTHKGDEEHRRERGTKTQATGQPQPTTAQWVAVSVASARNALLGTSFGNFRQAAKLWDTLPTNCYCYVNQVTLQQTELPKALNIMLLMRAFVNGAKPYDNALFIACFRRRTPHVGSAYHVDVAYGHMPGEGCWMTGVRLIQAYSKASIQMDRLACVTIG
jgi:hypothetical protein